MTLTLIPDLGDLFRLQPQFNAGTVAEILRGLGVKQLLWATSADPDHPLRDALPAAGIALEDLALPDWDWAQTEHHQLTQYLSQYPQGRERLKLARQAEQTFAEQLSAPLLTAQVLGADMMQAAQTYHAALREQLGEGPGTLWRQRRLQELSQALTGREGALLAPLDDLPDLLTLTQPAAQWPDLTGFRPGERSRLRALADRAWQLNEEDDPNALLEALSREAGDAVTPKAELDAAAAGIYLALGELDAARQQLERAAHALSDQLPRSVAGLTLARLGQVRDALGERDLALRTYRAVLALTYAPAVARQTAQSGLEQPFVLGGSCAPE